MEKLTITPAGQAALEYLAGVPFVILLFLVLVFVLLTILLPWYVYRSYLELRRIRKIAERWEEWMRRQR